MAKIFLSHSSDDSAKALAVARWLTENGWDDYFLDISPGQGLAPGERWQEALKAAAHRCEVVLCLISPAWRDSRWCFAEFLLAKQLGKTIFGILVENTPLDTLPKEVTAEWQLCDLVTGIDRRALHVAAEPVVPPTEVSFSTAGLTRLKIGLQKSGLDPATFPWPPPSDPERAPYRGLKALEAEDAAVFFGREAAITRGLDTLRGMRERGVERMLVILGASGAGKSSFLRAGLLPRLKRDDWHFLPLPVIRPERAVISGATGLVASLEVALREYKIVKTRADIRKDLERSDGCLDLFSTLQASAQRALGPDAEPPTIVISIDQSEELFGAEGREEVQFLLQLFGGVLASPKNSDVEAIALRRRALAVVAIRSDSFERLQTEPMWREVRTTLFSLPPLAREEYKMVIEGPAARATAAGRKLFVQPALTVQLLNDAQGADALPLLSFILERMFIEHGGDGDLRLDEYQAMGGLKGSINAAIKDAFAEAGRSPAIPIDESERARLLQQAFVPRLITVDPDTGVYKRRVAQWQELPVKAQPLIERLIAARLLLCDRRMNSESGDGSVVVEVAHEALISGWTQLSQWLDRDKEFLLWKQRLGRIIAEYERTKDEQSTLLRGVALAEADRWTRTRKDDLTISERGFIKASVEAANRSRRRRILLTGGILSLPLLAAVLLLWLSSTSGKIWLVQRDLEKMSGTNDDIIQFNVATGLSSIGKTTRARQVVEEIEDREVRTLAFAVVAHAASHLGDKRLAEELASRLRDEPAKIAGEAHDPMDKYNKFKLAAWAALLTGDKSITRDLVKKAEHAVKQAEQSEEYKRFLVTIADGLIQLTDLLERLDDHESAMEMLGEAKDILRKPDSMRDPAMLNTTLDLIDRALVWAVKTYNLRLIDLIREAREALPSKDYLQFTYLQSAISGRIVAAKASIAAATGASDLLTQARQEALDMSDAAGRLIALAEVSNAMAQMGNKETARTLLKEVERQMSQIDDDNRRIVVQAVAAATAARIAAITGEVNMLVAAREKIDALQHEDLKSMALSALAVATACLAADKDNYSLLTEGHEVLRRTSDSVVAKAHAVVSVAKYAAKFDTWRPNNWNRTREIVGLSPNPRTKSAALAAILGYWGGMPSPFGDVNSPSGLPSCYAFSGTAPIVCTPLLAREGMHLIDVYAQIFGK